MSAEYSSEQSNVKIERRLLLKFLLKYTKSHFFALFACLVLIALFTLVQVLHPAIIMVSIDDLINKDDRKVGLYENYEDFSGLSYGGNFYSSIAHRYVEPTNTMRLVQRDGLHYWIDLKATFDSSSEIIESDGVSYLKNGKDIGVINKANQSFINMLDEKNKNNLSILALAFIALLFLSFILEYAQGFLINVVSQRIVHSMRTELFEHICDLDMAYFEKNPVGRLVTRITNDLNNISQMYSKVLTVAVKDLAMVFGVAIVMFNINFSMSLITLSLFPILMIAVVIFRAIMLKLQRLLKVQLAAINAKLSEYIASIHVIQVFNAKSIFAKTFDEENLKYRSTNYDMLGLRAAFVPFTSFIMGVSLAVILYYGANGVNKGYIEIGLIVAFTNYVRQLYRPLVEFSSSFALLQSAIASLERLYLINETQPSIVSTKNAISPSKIRGKIEFKNVSFSYGDDEDSQVVLSDISLCIPVGKTCAIVGHTGSGKTTLISLIYRFYDVDSGEILIDDIPIKELSLDNLRRNMAMVLQDLTVFSDTISENIRLYDASIDQKQIIKSAKSVNADKFIENLDAGYNQVLKEAGNDLSMGERQLLSFARAIAHDPAILVLDEASSNIDSETELLIQKAIDKLRTKRTMIVIAHRLSTIKNADIIVVMNKGKIEEKGSHEELIKSNGMYKELYDKALMRKDNRDI